MVTSKPKTEFSNGSGYIFVCKIETIPPQNKNPCHAQTFYYKDSWLSLYDLLYNSNEFYILFLVLKAQKPCHHNNLSILLKNSFQIHSKINSFMKISLGFYLPD